MLVLINLDAAIERRLAMQAQFRAFGLAHERVGVDLRQCPPQQARNVAKEAFPTFDFRRPFLSSAELGCWLSHLTAWQLALRRGCSAFVVIEDDLILEPHFKDTCQRLVREMPRDLVYLGTSSRNISQRRAETFGPFRLHAPIGRILNTWAYAIDARFAARVLEAGGPIDHPIDHMLGSGRRYEGSLAVLSPAAVREDELLGRSSQIAPFTRRPDRALAIESLRRTFLRSRLGDAYYAALSRLF